MKKLYYLLFCFFANSISAQIVINEVYFLSKNQKTNQEFFVEFYNLGENKVSLSGYKLCLYDKNDREISCGQINTYKDRTFEVYPKNFSYTKINRNQKNDYFLYTQLDHYPDAILKLLDAKNNVIDAIELGYMVNGKSYCRYPDGANNWANAYATKDKKNRPHITISKSYFYNKETYSKKEALDSNKSNSYLKNKILINEVFFIDTHDEILRKDFWIELVNNSGETLPVENLWLSMDTSLENRKLISDSALNNIKKSVIIPNETWYIKITHHTTPALDETVVPLMHTSSTLFLYDGEVLLDSITVPILDRNESFARIPNGVGQFKVVKYETPSFGNDQVMPGIYSKPINQVIHTVGFGLSDYKVTNYDYKSTPRLCSAFGFAFQHNFKFLEMRHSLNYKRQSFGIRYDTTLTTNFGKITSATKGSQRMEYLGWSTEIGLPINQKFELFYGFDFDVMLNNVSSFITTTTSTTNSGVVTQSQEPNNSYTLFTDNVDFNLSIAIEYIIMENLKLNLSARRDFGGINIRSNTIGGQDIKTTVFQFRLVVPFYLSDKLAHKTYLLKQRKTKK